MRNVTFLGLFVATLVPVSRQIIDEFGGNFLLTWKMLLLLNYGLFDYHNLAVTGHLSILDKRSAIDLPGIDQSDLKVCQLKEQNEDQAQVFFLPQQCISDPWVCKWTKEGYNERSSFQLTDPFDCGKRGKVSWNDLPQQVELSFISTSTCSIVWRAEEAICHISFPAGETTYKFVGGGPCFRGVLGIDPAGCRWETTFLRCHPAVNMDKTDGKGLINKREGIVGRSLGGNSSKIRTKLKDLPQMMECTWNTDVMQPHLLSMVVRNQYLCADPGENLADPVHVKLSYDGSCTMFLEYQTTSCSLEVSKEKLAHSFLYGDSKVYPYVVGMFGKEMDECIWVLNVMQC